MRTDLAGTSVRRWANLWNPKYRSRIGIRSEPREIIGLTLLSMGHSLATEDPAVLESDLARLLKIRNSVVFIDVEASEAVRRLLSGRSTS